MVHDKSLDNLVNELLDYGIAYCHATSDEEQLSIWDHLKARMAMTLIKEIAGLKAELAAAREELQSMDQQINMRLKAERELAAYLGEKNKNSKESSGSA